MRVINKFRVPVKMWLEDIEGGALEQALHLSMLPFVHKHVAIMPDAHQGYGMPIGGVIACNDVIIPNAVGVDIGCGVISSCCGKADPTRGELHQIVAEIRNAIPTGFNKHKRGQKMPPLLSNWAGGLQVVGREYENACKSLGTLGGGNHFIEIQKDPDENVYIMIHSGSRNVGKQVADWYHKVAKTLNDRWGCSVPQDLAFLPVTCDEGRHYMEEMGWCTEFALHNRQAMMIEVQNIMKNVLANRVTFTPPTDVAHNYARPECHYGKTVWVHRKGATYAGEGVVGLIPGSQGTSSYIVKGLGNPLSFDSCSHGAGRKMSRNKAKAELSIFHQRLIMGDIIHDMNSKSQLDEAPGAYKDIDEVMENQKDLVEIVTRLKPIAVIKG